MTHDTFSSNRKTYVVGGITRWVIKLLKQSNVHLKFMWILHQLHFKEAYLDLPCLKLLYILSSMLWMKTEKFMDKLMSELWDCEKLVQFFKGTRHDTICSFVF